MIDESMLQHMCNKYNIKYKVFPQSDTIMLSTGLDDWMIKIFHNRDRPYCIYHKNKIRQTNKYHVQRWTRTLFQSIDVVVNHKKVLSSIFGSPQNTYKKYNKYKKRNKKNTNIKNKKGKTYC